MFKVLVVDDDIVVRTNLKTLIDWSGNGFEICGEASNGADALRKLEKDEYHIVITDMSMPVMDGIELIEQIERNHPSVKVIALSGYNDFDYVRQSLRKGAIDYVLKHLLSPEVLLGVLKAAGKAIQEEQQDFKQRQKQQEQLNQSRTVLMQLFINKLIRGLITDHNEILQTIQSLSINIGTRNLITIAAEIDGFFMIKDKNTDLLIQSFLNISEEVLKDFGDAVISYDGDGRFAIVAYLGKAYSYLYIHNRIIEMIDRIKSSMKRYLSITVSFGISSVCEDISNINRYYAEAEKALNNKFYEGKDRILWSDREQRAKEVFFSLDIKDENYIADQLRIVEGKAVLDYLEGIFSRAAVCNASYKSVQMVCAELFSIAHKTAKEFGVGEDFTNAGLVTPYEIINKFDTIQDIKEWLLQTFRKLISLLEASKMSRNYSAYTKKAIEFINKNYQKPISLADAAKYTGVSSQYLSTRFKEDCDMGFIDYLNHIRVERAKTLILGGESKLKEIVGIVGFNNYNYFFKVFKEIAGMTPAEFEKVHKR